MWLHVYDIEGKILRALSPKPIRSRQVAVYANQVLIRKFIQRLSGKKMKTNSVFINFGKPRNHCCQNNIFRKPATNQRQVILPLIKEKALPREPISSE